jgi:hypothetical protein
MQSRSWGELEIPDKALSGDWKKTVVHDGDFCVVTGLMPMGCNDHPERRIVKVHLTLGGQPDVILTYEITVGVYGETVHNPGNPIQLVAGANTPIDITPREHAFHKPPLQTGQSWMVRICADGLTVGDPYAFKNGDGKELTGGTFAEPVRSCVGGKVYHLTSGDRLSPDLLATPPVTLIIKSSTRASINAIWLDVR